MLLALKMEEEATGQGVQVASRSRGRKRFSPWSLQKEHGPADTLILVQ